MTFLQVSEPLRGLLPQPLPLSSVASHWQLTASQQVVSHGSLPSCFQAASSRFVSPLFPLGEFGKASQSFRYFLAPPATVVAGALPSPHLGRWMGQQKSELFFPVFGGSSLRMVRRLGWGYKAEGQKRQEGKHSVIRAAGPAGTGIRRSKSGAIVPTTPGQLLLVGIGVAYMTLIVFIPTANVFVQAFSNGIQPFIHNLFDPDFQHAVKMTLIVAGIVVPLNTTFGLIVALWLTRHDFPGKVLLISFLDLPFSISPVVVGLMLMLLYGRQGLFAPLLRALNFEVVFALPGMILATAFVTLPYVVREVIPVLNEMDPFEEEAARTMGANEWEVFWHVTLPNIRLGLLYGITLCNARAMGEFGAISVISGNIIGRTQTLTLFVESAYKEYNTQGAFSAAVLLSVLALITLVIKTRLEEMRAKESSR